MRRAAALVALMLVASACKIQIQQATRISEDESGTVSLAVGVDEELQALIDNSPQGDPFEELTSRLEGQGFTSQAWSEAGFEGVELVRTFADLDELDTAARTISQGENALFTEYRISPSGDGYEFRAVLSSFLDETGFEDSPIPISADLLADTFEIRIAVALPGTVTRHDADEVDGDLLVWLVGLNEEGRVLSAEAEPSSSFPVLPVALFAAVLVVAGVGAFWVSRRRPAPKPAPSPAAEEDGTPPLV